MINIKNTVLIAATLLAAASVYAGGGKSCGAEGKKGDSACSEAFSKLNLTGDQETKLKALKSECEAGGCTEESMEKFLKGAKEFLSAEQFAQLKSDCAEHSGKEKPQS